MDKNKYEYNRLHLILAILITVEILGTINIPVFFDRIIFNFIMKVFIAALINGVLMVILNKVLPEGSY